LLRTGGKQIYYQPRFIQMKQFFWCSFILKRFRLLLNRTASVYPIHNRGYKKVKSGDLQNQAKKIIPESFQIRQRKKQQNSHDSKTGEGKKSIEITFSHQSREKKHTDVYYYQEVVQSAEIWPKYTAIISI